MNVLWFRSNVRLSLKMMFEAVVTLSQKQLASVARLPAAAARQKCERRLAQRVG